MNPTAWLIIATIAILIGYDIFAAVKWGYDGTISKDILYASFSHPIIPLAAGILCGHLFWPQR